MDFLLVLEIALLFKVVCHKKLLTLKEWKRKEKQICWDEFVCVHKQTYHQKAMTQKQ